MRLPTGGFPALLAGLLLSAPALAQDSRPFPERMTVFRRVLFEQKLTPVTRLEDIDADTILIVLGSTDRLVDLVPPRDLLGLVNDGTAVLIATDRPQTGAARMQLEAFGVRLGLGAPTWNDPDEEHFYLQKPWCPKLQPLSVKPQAPQLFAPLIPLPKMMLPEEVRPRSVATNNPGYLVVPDRERLLLQELAVLPPRCVDEHSKDSLDRIRPSRHFYGEEEAAQLLGWGPLFAVGGEVGEKGGRVLVLADHSLFSNGMIYRHDNGNLEFTGQCLRWLQGEAPTRRSKVLLLDDGHIQPSFEVTLRPAPPLPPPSQEMVVAAVDEALARLEERDAFNQAVFQRLDAFSPPGSPRLVRLIVLGLTLVLFVYGCYRVGVRARHRPSADVPLLAQALAAHRPRASLLVLRQRAMRQTGNAWELARELARQCFTDLAPAEPDAAPPRFVVPGTYWHRWRAARRLRWLWQLAYGPTPVVVAPEKLPLLLAELQQVHADLQRGTIRLA